MIIESIVMGLIGVFLLAWGGLEWTHRRRQGNALEALPGNWQFESREPQHYRLVGEQSFFNPTRKLEVMIPEMSAEITLLSKGSLEDIHHRVKVTPKHADVEARPDGYWFAYIVKSRYQTTAEISVEITGPDLTQLKAVWVRIHYISYGPKGRIHNTHHEVIPLRFPDPQNPLEWRSVSDGQVLPVPTHLLTQLDTCPDIVRRYVSPHAQPGDIVTIGETPVAIMQGRTIHPSTIQPGWVATRLAYFFLPTSSLATACGLQTLVNIEGPVRVFLAFAVGAIAKVFGQAGMFYRLAGEQARLIDDVTGTLPPYDQFIVLGPDDPQKVVDQIQSETGLAAAIVDVNDLRRVKILAATKDAPLSLIEEALRSNPAGNADEQTPVVLIRPTQA
ncbi:F420-0:Gamma-glutamyl ligase [Acaryochloris sp. IP29b_bin.148]|uniref:F420-0:Gamma-glutamyl ligase n=1 Tax=Acaryochloris sp. IP29b_bin.148 TaxID=2969218 RepID=UPI0034522AD7